MARLLASTMTGWANERAMAGRPRESRGDETMFTRRMFLKTGSAATAGCLLRTPLARGEGDALPPRLALPSPAQLTWQECEIGLLYSFDLAIAAGQLSRLCRATCW